MTSFATYPSLADRGVLISGGGSGIGATLVEHFVAQGARVAFIDIASTPSRALCERLSGSSAHDPVYIECDVSDTPAFQSAIDQASAVVGGISILVNNAGDDTRHRFDEVTPEMWDERIAVLIKHQFFAAQRVFPGMKGAGAGRSSTSAQLAGSWARAVTSATPPPRPGSSA